MCRFPRYKAALAAALLALPGAVLAERVAGAVLPYEATKVGEEHFSPTLLISQS